MKSQLLSLLTFVRLLKDFSKNRRGIPRSDWKENNQYVDNCGTPEDFRKWMNKEDNRNKIKALTDSGRLKT